MVGVIVTNLRVTQAFVHEVLHWSYHPYHLDEEMVVEFPEVKEAKMNHYWVSLVYVDAILTAEIGIETETETETETVSLIVFDVNDYVSADIEAPLQHAFHAPH